MTRHFLFLTTLAFVLTLGWCQRVPGIAIVLGAATLFPLLLRQPSWWRGTIYLLSGIVVAYLCVALRIPRLTIQTGQQVSVDGLVIKNLEQASWISVRSCDKASCPSGVILPTSVPLGDRVHATCELLPLPDPGQPWKWWKQGIAATCQPLSRIQHVPDRWLGRLYRFRIALRDRIDQLFTPRSAGLVAGILFGDTSSMPLAVSTDFRRTGTTHIVALSGFNITIILQAVVSGLLPRVGRRWTTILGLALVTLFVVTTGASSSVVRAAVMAGIIQGVRLAGRPVHPDRLLLLTVIGMSLQNPWLVWHDLGFQLSLSSTFGLLQLRPALVVIGQWLPEVFEIRDNVLSTMAASLASAPILLVTFGGWSVISLLANVIVLPSIPIIMGLGALCLPFIWLPDRVASLIVSPVDLIERGVLSVLHALAQLPWAYTLIPPWGILLSIIGAIIGISVCYASSQRLDR